MKKKKKTNFKMSKYIIDKRKEILMLVCIFLFIFVTYSICLNSINQMDIDVHAYMLSIRSDGLTNIMMLITNISSAYAIIGLIIVMLFLNKNKKTSLLIIANLLLSIFINQTAKIIFSRPRPIGINLIEESGFSYPSGHAMISMAFFGLLAYLLYKSNKNKVIRYTGSILLIILIFLIGISRVYLGVHYISDIIGGFALSIVQLMIIIKLVNIKDYV